MIIGVNGFKGTGKDTIGRFLVNNYHFKRASFAAKLKQSAASLWDIDPELWESFKNNNQMRVMLYLADKDEPWEVKSDGDPNYFVSTITVRQFLQRYGTEAHRDIFGTDFWVKEALKDIDPAGNYVFTDARFTNELEAIRNLGGWNIRVIRNGVQTEDTHAVSVRNASVLDCI